MSVRYLIWIGTAFGLLAGLELLFKRPFGGILYFTPIHFAFNAVIAATSFAVAAKKVEALAKPVGMAVAIVLLLTFAAVMAAPAKVSDLLGYPIGWPYLLIHLTLGVAGLILVSFKSKSVVKTSG